MREATTAAPAPPVPTAWYVRHRREEARRGILIGGGGSKDQAESARAGKAKATSRVATMIQQQEAEASMLRASAASALSMEAQAQGARDSAAAEEAAAGTPATYHRVPLGSGATRLPVLAGDKAPSHAADALSGRVAMRLIATPALGTARPSRVPTRIGAPLPVPPSEAVERALGGLQVRSLDDFGVRFTGQTPSRRALPPPRRPAAEIIAEAHEEARKAVLVGARGGTLPAPPLPSP